MKSFHFSIVFSCCIVQVFGADAYTQIVDNLKRRIKSALDNYNNFLNNVKQCLKSLSLTTFGVERRPEIKELKHRLCIVNWIPDCKESPVKLKQESNEHKCRGVFDSKLRSFLRDLEEPTRLKLVALHMNLLYPKKNLLTIQSNLQGSALDKNIKTCEDKEKHVSDQCPLTDDYDKTLLSLEGFIKENTANLTSPQLTSIVAAPLISETIYKKVLRPVNACLKGS